MTTKTITVPLDLLKKAALFAGNDRDMPALAQVIVEQDRIFATDSYALAVTPLPDAPHGEPQYATTAIAIPTQIVKDWKAKKDMSVTIEADGDMCVMTCGPNSTTWNNRPYAPIKLDSMRNLIPKPDIPNAPIVPKAFDPKILAKLAKLEELGDNVYVAVQGDPLKPSIWAVGRWQVLVMPRKETPNGPAFTI